MLIPTLKFPPAASSSGFRSRTEPKELAGHEQPGGELHTIHAQPIVELHTPRPQPHAATGLSLTGDKKWDGCGTTTTTATLTTQQTRKYVVFLRPPRSPNELVELSSARRRCAPPPPVAHRVQPSPPLSALTAARTAASPPYGSTGTRVQPATQVEESSSSGDESHQQSSRNAQPSSLNLPRCVGYKASGEIGPLLPGGGANLRIWGPLLEGVFSSQRYLSL